MEYTPNAIELIDAALAKSEELRASNLSDDNPRSIDLGRKYLAFMSQFSYRWLGIDPSIYKFLFVSDVENEKMVTFELREERRDLQLPEVIFRRVSNEMGELLNMANEGGKLVAAVGEGIIQASLFLLEVTFRYLPPIAEELKTVESQREHGSPRVEFERSTDYMRIWINGQEWRISEPQSRFLTALDRVFPEGATWETIQKLAPRFTHAKASEVFKGNKGGAKLRRMILLSGDVWKLQSKPVLKVIGGTAI